MSPRLRRAVNIALVLTGIDLLWIVSTGGVSVLGPVDGGGFAIRVLLILGLLTLHVQSAGQATAKSNYVYVVLLLFLLLLLHNRGYRLRGDGLWYYSYSHSIVFDGDIDLTNQYRRLGIDHLPGSQPVRETGNARFTFPVGAPLAWLPFVELGHLGAWLRNAQGLDTQYDGFSDPYLHTVALGNLLIGWLGLLVLDRFLGRWFSPWTSTVATVGIGMGSFLAWYMAYQPIYTHGLTFLLVSLILTRWVDEPRTVRDYALLGLLVGLAAAVRWQNGVFALLPAWSLGRKLLQKRWRWVGFSTAAFGGALLLGILPQLVTWKIIFGRFFIGVPLGADYMRWEDPFLTEMLFSSRHGLLSWSPLLALAALGFLGFVRHEPRRGLPLLGMLLILTYINSAVADWWAGGSFGARRFDSALPILALGLATAIAWITGWVGRRPGIAVTAFLGVFVGANLLLMEQYRKGRIPTDDTLSWEVAAGGMREDIFDAVGYPFSFPANWLFAFKYDRPKTQYDLLVGKYLFHRMNHLGGVIDLGENDPPFIGNGWSGVKDWEERTRQTRWAVGPRAGVFVPTDRAESLVVLVECASPEGRQPQWIEVWLNDHKMGGFLPEPELKEKRLVIDERWWSRINLLEFVPTEKTEGAPYLVVDQLRFERIE